MSRRKTGIILIGMLFFCAVIFSGCEIASAALVNISSQTDNMISKKSILWSGVSINSFTVEEEEELLFEIDLDNGEVAITILNSDNEEIYNITAEEEGLITESFQVEEAGTYQLKQTGKKFSGNYKLIWGEEE